MLAIPIIFIAFLSLLVVFQLSVLSIVASNGLLCTSHSFYSVWKGCGSYWSMSCHLLVIDLIYERSNIDCVLKRLCAIAWQLFFFVSRQSWSLIVLQRLLIVRNLTTVVVSCSLGPQFYISGYGSHAAISTLLNTCIFALWSVLSAPLSSVEVCLAPNCHNPIESSLSDLYCRIILVVSALVYVWASCTEKFWLIKYSGGCWYTTLVKIGNLLLLIDNRILWDNNIICAWL